MTFFVFVTKPAEQDLRDIYLYIATVLEAPGNAESQLDRLEQQIAKLEYLPERFPEYPDEPWKSRGFRVMPVDNYLVYYVPNIPAKTVNVMRVMYKGRDSRKNLADK